mgnify:CR=1 FL=1
MVWSRSITPWFDKHSIKLCLAQKMRFTLGGGGGGGRGEGGGGEERGEGGREKERKM